MHNIVVVVYSDLSEKESHGQVGVSKVVTLGTLDSIMSSTLTWNARDLGSIPALGAIFPIFITHTLVLCGGDLVQTKHCMVVKPTLCMYVYVSTILYVYTCNH